MPSKKKKYNARFPAGRIKKIMQTDKEVGKVAQAVPIIISRTLELFVESLLTKSMHITQSRFARTLTPSHMKQCILSESRFDFLKDLVNNVPDASVQEDNENNLLFDADHRDSKQSSCQSKPQTSQSSTPQEERKKASSVIKYGPASTQSAVAASSTSHSRKVSASESNSSRSSSYSKKDTVSTVCSMEEDETESEEETDDMDSVQTSSTANNSAVDNVPPLIPISNSTHSQVRSDSLVIDEDYDN